MNEAISKRMEKLADGDSNDDEIDGLREIIDELDDRILQLEAFEDEVLEVMDNLRARSTLETYSLLNAALARLREREHDDAK